jgi:uncharacterized oxidoreductase
VKTDGNTILITGGATGIGLSLTKIFVETGNEVVICGRRREKLNEAKEQLPGIHVRACDISGAAERKSLVDWTLARFGRLNVLVNNAGIQQQIDFRKGTADFSADENEIDINLAAPVHLSALLLPHLMQQPEAAILNITSGLGFAPVAIMPVYCATKAAMHSFTLSLRHQLKDTSVKVYEIIPPTVDTELDRGARANRGQTDRGIKTEEVVAATMEALAHDVYEAAIGRAQFLREESRKQPDQLFKAMNDRSH